MAEPWTSQNTDPLIRLVDNAVNLLASVCTIADLAKAPASQSPSLNVHLPIFTERLRAVATHKGPEWGKLNAANPEPIEQGRHVAMSHVGLALNYGVSFYQTLLRMEDRTKAAAWIPSEDGYSDLDHDALTEKWEAVNLQLQNIPSPNQSRLRAHIMKEYQRATSTQIVEPDEGAKAISRPAAATLVYLSSKYPSTCALIDLPGSKNTASKVVNELIGLGYAERPAGPNQGAAATQKGLGIAAQLGK